MAPARSGIATRRTVAQSKDVGPKVAEKETKTRIGTRKQAAVVTEPTRPVPKNDEDAPASKTSAQRRKKEPSLIPITTQISEPTSTRHTRTRTSAGRKSQEQSSNEYATTSRKEKTTQTKQNDNLSQNDESNDITIDTSLTNLLRSEDDTPAVKFTPQPQSNVLASLANFKHRSRQPSILNMQSHFHHTNDVAQDLSVDESGISLNDFTLTQDIDETVVPPTQDQPFSFQQHHSSGGEAGETVPATQEHCDKDDQVRIVCVDDPDELYALSPRPSRGKKRKSDEMVDGSAVVTEHQRIPSSPPKIPRDSSILSSAPSKSSPLRTYSTQTPSSPRLASDVGDTFAEPESAPPSPIRDVRKPTNTARVGSERVVTSAMLRALLPKRHFIRNTRLESSDADDGSETEVEMKRKTKRRVLVEVKNGSKDARKNKKGGGKENTNNKKTRTGGERREEDSDVESNADGEGVEKLSEELRAAREKFRMIDQGELEFESASLGGGDSSPWR